MKGFHLIIILNLLLFTVTAPVSAALITFNIIEVNEISSGSNICDLEVFNEVLFSLDMQNGLKTYDISNLSDPILLGTCIDSYSYGHAVILDRTRNLAYVADYEDGLEIVNISDPTELSIIASYMDNPNSVTWPGSTDIDYMDGIIYLASQDNGLQIINVSDPFNPSKIEVYYNQNSVSRVDVSDHYIFINEVGKGLTILDRHDPTIVLNSWILQDSVQETVLRNELLYLACSDSEITILDFQNVSNLFKVGSIDIKGEATDILITEENIIVVVMWDHGLEMFNISTTLNPVKIGEFDDGGNSLNVLKIEEYLFVAEYQGGLEILKMIKIESNETIPGFFGVSELIGCLVLFVIFSKKDQPNS
jgi:hypothetical protein